MTMSSTHLTKEHCKNSQQKLIQENTYGNKRKLQKVPKVPNMIRIATVKTNRETMIRIQTVRGSLYTGL